MTSCGWRATGPQGKLRVDVPVAFGKYLLLPAIPQFTQRYPDISLEVRFNDRYVDMQARRRRRGGARRQGALARSHRQAHLRPRACSPARRPSTSRSAGMPRTPEDLRKHRLIGHLRGDADRPADWQFKQGDGTRSLRLPMALSFNTVEALSISALEGQGIVQQLDLLVGGYSPRAGWWRCCASTPAKARRSAWSIRAPRSISPRCACSRNSPPISCATTRRACAAARKSRTV